MILKDLEDFKQNLRRQEKREKTITQYSNYIIEFIEQTKIKTKEDITKELLIEYKENYLKGLVEDNKTKKLKARYTLATINIKILIINKFIIYLELPKEFRLKQEKQQRENTLENVLTEKEYQHLRDYAKSHKQNQLYYLMGTLEGTGIRVSELKFITVEAVRNKVAIVYNKKKKRKVPLQDKVTKELLQYCKEENIQEGIIFKSKYGNPLDNAYIWKQLQKLARTS